MTTEFNRIITLLRKERGLTQKQAAQDLGVSQALLSHYEKGIRECGLDFVIRVAEYYDVSCDYLLGRSADQDYIDDHQQELTQFTDVSPYYWAYYDIMEAVNEHSSTKQNGVESWSDVKKK